MVPSEFVKRFRTIHALWGDEDSEELAARLQCLRGNLSTQGKRPITVTDPVLVLSNDSTCHGGFRAPHFDPEEDEEALRGVDEMFLPCSLAFPECNRTAVFFVSISPRHLYPLYAMLHVVRGCENRQYSRKTPKTAPRWWCTRYVQAAESICVPNERISCATVLLIRRVDQTDFTADIEISRMIDTG